MIAETGRYALILALFVAAVQACAPLIGVRLAVRAALLQAALVALAFVCLLWLFAVSDFSLAAVAANSHSSKPLLYKVAGSWSNHEGSMLLWMLILAGFGAAFACRTADDGSLRTHALAVQGAVGFGFLLYLLFASDPFARLDPVPIDGEGLNPLLQDIGLVFHPPLLYLGYVGASLPFSLAVAVLIDGRLDAARVHILRRWALVSWLCLTLGIGIGAWWSYYTLGWGGFWAWDPVENASLMPWLLATALIHTASASERRGALKGWTVLLSILVFALALAGTFLVRSGTVASVHAFAVDPMRGLFILILMVALAGGALALYAWRAGRLSRDPPFARLSRESAILAGMAVLLLACAAVLAGTLYPMAAHLLGLGMAAVGAGYFNQAAALLCLPLLLLAAVGPLLAWRRGRLRAMLPALARMPRSAAIAHLGLVLLVGGIVLAAVWQSEATASLRPGDSLAVGGYTVHFDAVREVHGGDHDAVRGAFTVSKNGEPVAVMHPELRRFENPPAAKAEIAIHTDLLRDLHLVLGEADADGRYGVQAMLKPAMPLVFFAMALIALGGMIALARRRMQGAVLPAKPAAGRMRIVAPAGFAALAVLFALVLWRGATPEEAPALPDLPTLSGETLRFSDVPQPLVVNVFASWCAPCRDEFPALMRLAKTTTVIGIAFRDRPEKVKAMLAALGNPYATVGLDDGEAGRALNISGVPETLIVDDGRIVWRQAGPLDAATVEREILPRLGRVR